MGKTAIRGLTTDYFIQPVGVGKNPHFGWQLESEERDVCQNAFRFQLAVDTAFDTTLWDSGVVLSGQSAHYCPEDLPLTSATRYYWRVQVRLTPDGPFHMSPTATFVTALLDSSLWQARFISAETESDATVSKGTYVQGSLMISGEVKTAYAFSTALGLYHLSLNGEKIGEDQLAPGWTSYRKHLLYQAYDITAMLRPGENTVRGHLGAGWYKGLMGFLHNRNNYGRQTALLCQIQITYLDGRTQTFYTDESWVGTDSPVLFSEIYDGEIYDARRTPDALEPVQVVPFDLAVLEAQAGCRVKITETLPVTQMLTTPQGDCVLDFGQNLTGWVRFTVSGNAGDTVELRCFETLDAQGNVYTANLRDARQTLRYVLRGEGTETYAPSFTFQGFRYVHVVAYPGAVQPQAFTAYVVHSDLPRTGSFTCSNPLLNQLEHNIVWSLKGNFLDIPTDCPQRDERMGWTGDAQIFCPTACYLVSAYPFFRKWLRDLACDQVAEGGVPHVVPDILTGYPNIADNWLLSQGTHSAAAWSDAAVLIPWNLYLAYGDTQILREQYASMKAWVNFMHRHANGCVWQYQLQFGDWVALDAAEGSYYGATPNAFVCAAYYAHTVGIFAKIAAILQNEQDRLFYEHLHRQIVNDFAATFFSPAGELLVHTQTAHVLALQFQLMPPQYVPQTVQALHALLARENGHLVTGFVGTPYIAHALSDYGRLSDAYRLVLREDFPSWLYQVKAGATTIWEHWDGIKPDGSMWSADMNSFNHYAYGAIGAWLYRNIGGLQPDEAAPGYRHTVIHPRIGGGLTYANTALETVYGRVSTHWQLHGGQVTLTVHVPCNTTATLCLDATEVQAADGLLFAATDEGVSAQMGSGTYTVAYRLREETPVVE